MCVRRYKCYELIPVGMLYIGGDGESPARDGGADATQGGGGECEERGETGGGTVSGDFCVSKFATVYTALRGDV